MKRKGNPSRLTFHGARGSYPVSGPAYRRHGGHTCCIALETARGILVVDAGTGLAALGDALSRRRGALPPITILLTHLHLDHVAGLASFRTFLRRGAKVTLMADARLFPRWTRALKTLAAPPFWPVRLLDGPGGRLKPLPVSRRLDIHGVKVSWSPVRHPQGGVSYRLSTGGKEVVVATDREPGDRRMDRAFLDFCRGADILVHDAQFTPAERPAHRGWGHSTWKEAARAARQAGGKALVLTCHNPSRTDGGIDRLLKQAQREFWNTRAAREGMRISLTGGRPG